MDYFTVSTGSYYYFICRSLGYIINVSKVFYDIFDVAINGKNESVIDLFKDKYDLVDLTDALCEIRYYQENELIHRITSYLEKDSKTTTKDIVERNYSICNQLLLQVTESCQLSCKYCFYGDIYNTNSLNDGKSINNEVAIKFIYETINKWRNLPSIYMNDTFYIGFYGGEPLLNFKLISDIVELVDKIKPIDLKIKFTMTTNGLLLQKYSEFLVLHDFEILVSLDGDYKSNSNRVFRNLEESFSIVKSNCIYVKENYPVFFRENVFFNSVFTSLSSLEDILAFFQENFNKVPNITPLSSVGVKDEYVNTYQKLSCNLLDELCSNKDIKNYELYRQSNNPLTLSIHNFFKSNDLDFFSKYPAILYRQSTSIRNGTCTPFFKKIYLDANSNILPCEKLFSEVILGTVDKDKVHIDFNGVAVNYNNLMKERQKVCQYCFNSVNCNQCLYTCFSDNRCTFFSTFEDGIKQYQRMLNLLEKNDDLVNLFLEYK